MPEPVVRRLPLLLLLLLLSACALPQRGPVGGDVADTRQLPQNLMFYASEAPDLLTDPQTQTQLLENYRQRHFAPWRQDNASFKPEDAFWGIARYGSRQGFGENMLPRSEAWFASLAEQCRVQDYPSLARHGVALRNSALRVMPTHRPFFYDFALAGEGYPFDYFQNSALWAGTPLFVSHATPAGDWLYCEAAFAAGWVPASDVGLIPPGSNFIDEYTNRPLAAVVRDNVALHEENGRFLLTAHVGAVFPLSDEDRDGLTVLAPKAHPEHGVVAVKARIPRHDAQAMPLPFRAVNVARVGNAMLGQLYGWGGMYENRDCSAMVRDLFAPFGVWLPRNSRVQASQGGRVVELADIAPETKEALIIEQAVPFATLVGMPGHIMLYIGQRQGKALVYHNLWGLRTVDFRGEPGRYILGRAVVTSLTPGRELGNLDPSRELLNRVSSLTFVAEPAPEPAAED